MNMQLELRSIIIKSGLVVAVIEDIYMYYGQKHYIIACCATVYVHVRPII